MSRQLAGGGGGGGGGESASEASPTWSSLTSASPATQPVANGARTARQRSRREARARLFMVGSWREKGGCVPARIGSPVVGLRGGTTRRAARIERRLTPFVDVTA